MTTTEKPAQAKADPIMERLLGADGAFEVSKQIIDDAEIRTFKNAPPTLVELLNRARDYGDTEFLVQDDQRLTFSDFFERADQFSAWLIARPDLKARSVVAIAMQNAVDWMIAYAGVIFAGGVPALINSRLNGEKLLEQVEDSAAALLVADERRYAALREVGCTLPSVISRLSEKQTVGGAPGVISFEDARAPSGGSSGGSGPSAASPDDVAVLLFTSGTTGRAKAAALTHRNVVTGVMNTELARAAIVERMAEAYGATAEQIAAQMPQASSLLVFPLFHTSGCNATFLPMLTGGGKVVIMQKWDPARALDLVAVEAITALAGVPTMLWDIVNEPSLGERELPSLRSFSSGGQALPVNLLNTLQEKFPQAFIGAGYGMTETSGAVSQATGPEYLKYPESAGRVLPMVDVRIVDDQGNSCALGDVGEIHVKGAVLMKGYRRANGELYGKNADGWFATGDIGRMNDEGYIFVVDRKTDMVISGGENIYCVEVEQAIKRHPLVEDAVAFGIPDPRLGEQLVVVATSANGQDLSVHDLISHSDENLPAYRRPKQISIRSTPFERNAMGKVNKAALREEFLNQD
ncbi:MAG: class I adenylate-forming enzyme family protein [Pseudomonadota bacterium]